MNGPRRLVVIPAIGGLAAAALLSWPPAALAAVDGCQDTASASDFNGDGYDDAAVGDPEATVDGHRGAGAVTVLLGGPDGRIGSGPRRVITRASLGETPHAGDHFGFDVYLAPAGLNAGCADLLVGSPGADVGGAVDAGTVHLVRDLPDREGTPEMDAVTLTQADAGGTVEAGDRFGYAVAITDTTEGEPRRLVLGSPGEDAGSVKDAGAVNVTNGDLSAGDSFELRQGRSPRTGAVRLPGTVQADDRFGAAVVVGRVDLGRSSGESAGQVLIMGAPGDHVGGHAGAGSVTVLAQNLGTTRLISQDSSGVSGSAESGDRFGASLALSPPANRQARTLAVGSPGEDAGRLADTGSVTLFTNTDDRFVPRTTFSQATSGVPGTNEPGDEFGSSLAYSGPSTLLVGVPSEDVGARKDAGRVQPVQVPAASPLRFLSVITERSPGGGHRFGRSLGALQGQSENIATVFSEAGQGLVYVLSDREGQRTWVGSSGAGRFGWSVTN